MSARQTDLACAADQSVRTLFLLHEQRFLYFQEPSYLELYLPMKESGLLGETSIHPYQRDIRFACQTKAGSGDDAGRLFASLLHQKILEFRPQLVVYALTWPHESIPPEHLLRLKEQHGFRLASVIWDHDEANPLLQEYDRKIIEISDCTVVADSLSRATAIRRGTPPYQDFRNAERVVFLPMVPPASLFFPRQERLHDITISGSCEGYRRDVFQHLVDGGFVVHRSGGMMDTDVMLPIAAYAKDLATSRIVVNTQTQASRVQIKGRVAQCLASGTFLLEQDNAESRAYLEGIDVATWRTLEELTQLLNHHLAHPDEREAMAQRAHLQWKEKYAVEAFVKTILRVCENGSGLSSADAAPLAPPLQSIAPPRAEKVNTMSIIRPKAAHAQSSTRIFIHTGNHNNSAGIGDTVLFLKNALLDCGCDARISHRIEPGQVNILMEHFLEESKILELSAGLQTGARYILIGTEPIVGGTFNGGIDDSHFHYSNKPYWELRFGYFSIAATMASAVWVLAEDMLPAYRALLPQLPVRFLPHGYVNNFATVHHRAERDRDIDFYFSGSLTDHRKQILRDLKSTHNVVYNDIATPEYLRQDHLSRAKVCLSMRLAPNNVIPSVSRMHYHLQNRNFLLQERYAEPCPLDPFVMQVPDGDLAEWARAALELTNRREIAEAALDRFKAAMPMTEILPPLLNEALARASAPAGVEAPMRLAVGA